MDSNEVTLTTRADLIARMPRQDEDNTRHMAIAGCDPSECAMCAQAPVSVGELLDLLDQRDEMKEPVEHLRCVVEELNERWGPISTSLAYLVRTGRLAIVDDNGYRVPTNQERSRA